MIGIQKNKLNILCGAVWAFKKSFLLVFIPFFALLAYDLNKNGISWNLIWFMIALPFLLVGLLTYMVRRFFNLLINDPINALLNISSDIYFFPSEKGFNSNSVENLINIKDRIVEGSLNNISNNNQLNNKKKPEKKIAKKNKANVQDVQVK